MAGFPHYDEIPVVAPPTLGELVDSLTGQQKGQILTGYTKNTAEITVAKRILVPESTVFALYGAIKAMVDKSNALMREEVVLVPAVIDEDPDSPTFGQELSPAQFNTPPASAAALLAEVQDDFSEYFSGAEVTAVLTAMVEYSKHDGSGNWAFYSTEVIK